MSLYDQKRQTNTCGQILILNLRTIVATLTAGKHVSRDWQDSYDGFIYRIYLKYSDALRELDILGRFLDIFQKGRQIVWLSICFPAHQASSEKGSTLIGKNKWSALKGKVYSKMKVFFFPARGAGMVANSSF